MFTLLLLCVAGVVDAQNTVKGWFEVDVQAISREPGYTELSGDHAARVEDDAYVVYARSKEQAAEAGTTDFQAWDSQFFLTFGKANALKEGAKFRLRMSIKSDPAIAGVASQAHQAPGSYNAHGIFSDLSFSEDWEAFDSGEKTVSSDMGKGDGFYTIAFNIATGTEATYYFKDIIFEVYGDKPATPTLVSKNVLWTPLIQNSDCEGTENTSYRLRQYPYTKGQPADPVALVPGVGVDGSQGIKIETNDMVEHEWDSQFWFTFNEAVTAGTVLRVKFDYRSENPLVKDDGSTVEIPTQAHTLNPGGVQEADGEDSYNHYEFAGNVGFTTEWQHFEKDNLSVNSDHAKEGRPMGSIAFNLNQFNPANIYYFDNVYVDKYDLLNDVRNDEAGGFRILFTEYTNMPDLVKAIAGKKRRIVLTGEEAGAIVKITVNDAEAPVESVEFDKEGALYAFLDEEYVLPENAKIVVKFTNPENAKYQLLYTSGDNINQPVEDFEMESKYDDEVDIIPNSWLSPELESADPENGSFCLPSTISEFKVVFDKEVNVSKLYAKLDDKEKLNVAQGETAAEVILKRTDTKALAEGEHTIKITGVYSKNDVNMYEDSPASLTFSVGPKAMSPKLQRAIDNAIAVIEESEADERYQGEAYAALKAAVAKYEAEGADYTAPSQVQAALDDLSLKTEAQKVHYNLCKSYDDNLASAVELVQSYGESKFAAHPLYAELAAAVGKYEGKVLTDDKELDEAVKDLEANVKVAKDMFTEGVSKNGDAGIKVLVDRIRRGAEALTQSFDVAEDDELIVAANNAIADDDDLAAAIKNRITLDVYGKLKDGDASLFSSSVDEETDEETLEGPDMSVFVKNPNMYALYPANGISLENTPGWDRLNGNMGLYGSGGSGWGNPRNIEGLPEDCAFTIYHGDTRAEQTITGLPAGNYRVTFYGTDWGNTAKADDDGNPGPDALGFVYVKTSDTPAVEEGEEEDRDVHFAGTCGAFYAEPQYSMDGEHNVEVTVTDGKLVIGLQFASDSQYFFGDVKLTLIGAAEGFDYTKAYEDVAASIEAIKQNVNYNVYFDLQGRRIANPSKGLYIKNNKVVVVK